MKKKSRFCGYGSNSILEIEGFEIGKITNWDPNFEPILVGGFNQSQKKKSKCFKPLAGFTVLYGLNDFPGYYIFCDQIQLSDDLS